MKKIVVAVFLLFSIGNEVMSDCRGKFEQCGDGVGCCPGAGVCKQDVLGISQCICDTDGSSCSSSVQCCSGLCNSRGYCGCIASGDWCTSGKSEECCGKASSIDSHLIKTCTAAFPIHYECY